MAASCPESEFGARGGRDLLGELADLAFQRLGTLRLARPELGADAGDFGPDLVHPGGRSRGADDGFEACRKRLDPVIEAADEPLGIEAGHVVEPRLHAAEDFGIAAAGLLQSLDRRRSSARPVASVAIAAVSTDGPRLAARVSTASRKPSSAAATAPAVVRSAAVSASIRPAR